MRNLVLMLVLVVGSAKSTCAFDIPPPKDLKQVIQLRDEPSTFLPMSTVGTVVGGSMLAAAMLFGGLWLSRKRKATSS